MARRLLDAGYMLRVWNRTRAKAEALAEQGAEVCDTPADAAKGADLVVTMLESGEAVESVLFGAGVAKMLLAGSTVIDMSSISPATARDHAERFGALGIAYLDAPVSGGTRGAADGTLAIMVGGDPNEFERCSDVLAVFGGATLVGPSGSGQVTKLANQMIVGATIAVVAEALVMVRAAGVEPAIALQALRKGFADSRILEEHGTRMIQRNFEPGAASRLQLKDLVTAIEAAGDSDHDLRITSLVASMYESLCESGGSELDHSALLLEFERTDPEPTDEQAGTSSGL